MPRSHYTRAGRWLAALAGAGLLAGCSLGSEVPTFPLSAAQREWLQPYQEGAIWRFRSQATGYERTYRMQGLTETVHAKTKGRFTTAPIHYQQQVFAELLRTDSAFTYPYQSSYRHLLVRAAADPLDPTDPQTRAEFTVQLTGGSFAVPAEQVAGGTLQSNDWEVLPQYVHGGTAYTDVVLLRDPNPYPGLHPTTPRVLYYSKLGGPLRFDCRSGERWERF